MKSGYRIVSVLVTFVALTTSLYAQSLFTEAWDGPDGTRPSGWSIIEAPPLSAGSNYWFLSEGALASGDGDNRSEVGVNTGGWSFAVVDSDDAASWDNYTVQVDIRMVQKNGRAGIVGRWQDVDNYYRGFVSSISGRREIGIQRIRNGQESTLGLQGPDTGVVLPEIEQKLSALDRNTLTMTFAGDQISIALDGTNYVTVSDSTFPRGTAGVTQQDNEVYFDNFSVKSVSEQSADAGFGGTAGFAPTASGGLESAAPPSSGVVYRIVVARGVSQADANSLKSELEDFGYPVVDVVPKGNMYDVVVGSLTSEMDANASKSMLEEDGYQVIAVEQIVGDQADDLMRRSAPEMMASSGPAKSVIRVLIKAYPTMADAQVLKDSLDSDGYFSEIVNYNGNYGVVIGRFGDMLEANKFVDNLQNDGYISSQAVEMSSGATVADGGGFVAPPTTEDISTIIAELDTDLSGEQLEEVTNIISSSYSENVMMDEIYALQDKIKKLEIDQRAVVSSVRDEIEKRAKVRDSVAQLMTDALNAKKIGNYDVAEVNLNKILELDPSRRATVEWELRLINNLKNNKSFVDDDLIKQRREQITAAEVEAKAAEEKGNLIAAMSYWQQVVNLARDGSPSKDQARQRVNEIQAELNRQETDKQKSQQQKIYIIAGAAGIVVLVLCIVLFFMWRSKRSMDKQLLDRVKDLTIQPPVNPQTGQPMATGGPMAETSPPPGAMELGSAPVGAEPQQQAPPPPSVESAPPVETAPPPMEMVPPPVEAGPPPMGFESPPSTIPEPSPATAEGSDMFAMPSFETEDDKPLPPPGQKTLPTPSDMNEMEEVSLDDFSFDDEPAPPVVEAPEQAPASDEVMELDMSSISVDDLNLGFETEPAPPEPAPPAPESLPEPEAAPPAPETPPAPKPEQPELEIELPDEPKPINESPFDSMDDTLAEPPVSQPEVQEPSDESAPPQAAATEKQPDPDQTVAAVPPVVAPVPIPASKAPAAEAVPTTPASSEEIIFNQNFNDEEDGSVPNNWNGSYDYASLEVVSDEAVGDSAKCMKFEKKTGAGSAYYSCQFPNAGGKVSVEFDLRCDNKNKYLLGFYIEKDKDFRKSVHSIIHRTATATHPTLRIQGEPVEYTLGEWRHIKYVLDLNAGFVDGYVDGQKAADHVKLENVPEYVNTLAIRDNLPTTGILRVGNIIVKKMA